MGRPHRRGSETGIHHVMNRGVDHQPIFYADADRLELGRRLAAVHERFEVTTLAYCLMPTISTSCCGPRLASCPRRCTTSPAPTADA